MATHTIEIDDETKTRLEANRINGESLGEVIRRHVPVAPSPADPPLPPNAVPAKHPIRNEQDLEDWFARMRANPISEEAAAAVEEVIAQRSLPINSTDPWGEALADLARDDEQAAEKTD
jgi:hypothetical protein